MPVMSKLTAAYLAGFLDGEGCFTIFARSNSKKYHSVINGGVVVSSTDLEILQWLKDSFGGFVTKPRHNGPNRKLSSQWSLNDKEQINKILLKIIPYLKTKKRQAELLYKFNKTFGKHSLEKRQTKDKWGRVGGLRVKPEVLEERRIMLEEMRVLNKRGLQAKRLNEVAPFKR